MENFGVRKQTVRDMGLPGHFIAERMSVAASDLSRRGTMAARVELANEAISKLIHLLYEKDEDGVMPNVDAAGAILVPVPWGSSGWNKYGLRDHEARTLRKVLSARLTDNIRPDLFLYDEKQRRWFLNLEDWGSEEKALFWLSKSEVKLAEWRQFAR